MESVPALAMYEQVYKIERGTVIRNNCPVQHCSCETYCLKVEFVSNSLIFLFSHFFLFFFFTCFNMPNYLQVEPHSLLHLDFALSSFIPYPL